MRQRRSFKVAVLFNKIKIQSRLTHISQFFYSIKKTMCTVDLGVTKKSNLKTGINKDVPLDSDAVTDDRNYICKPLSTHMTPYSTTFNIFKAL